MECHEWLKRRIESYGGCARWNLLSTSISEEFDRRIWISHRHRSAYRRTRLAVSVVVSLPLSCGGLLHDVERVLKAMDVKQQVANIPYAPDRAAATKDALASSVDALEQLAQVVAEIERRPKE